MKIFKIMSLALFSFLLLTGFSKGDELYGVVTNKIQKTDSEGNEFNYITIKGKNQESKELVFNDSLYKSMSLGDEVIITNEGKVYINGEYSDEYESEEGFSGEDIMGFVFMIIFGLAGWFLLYTIITSGETKR
ncbi:hypothetical protein [Staphylococcus phage vB_StaM_SA1]|nr:hypothetical protein [Staphylococcus phage vB_StaM_SA1]